MTENEREEMLFSSMNTYGLLEGVVDDDMKRQLAHFMVVHDYDKRTDAIALVGTMNADMIKQLLESDTLGSFLISLIKSPDYVYEFGDPQFICVFDRYGELSVFGVDDLDNWLEKANSSATFRINNYGALTIFSEQDPVYIPDIDYMETSYDSKDCSLNNIISDIVSLLNLDTSTLGCDQMTWALYRLMVTQRLINPCSTNIKSALVTKFMVG